MIKGRHPSFRLDAATHNSSLRATGRSYADTEFHTHILGIALAVSSGLTACATATVPYLGPLPAGA